jgi:hypothetical protein
MPSIFHFHIRVRRLRAKTFVAFLGLHWFDHRTIPCLRAFPNAASGPGSAPPVPDDPLLSGATDTKKEEGDGVEGGVVKANKGMILRKSVEYIRCARPFPTRSIPTLQLLHVEFSGICNSS